MTTRFGSALLALSAILALGCSSSTENADARSANDANTGSQHRGGNASQTSGGSDGAGTCGAEPVYFAFDSSDLDDRARRVVERDAECVTRQQAAAHVVGMTDPRGTEEYNLALGDRRARSVATHMGRLGVNDVATRSVGEEMSAGDEDRGWATDRRAEISVRR